MFEANFWNRLFLIASNKPDRMKDEANRKADEEADRIANDPVHRARRAREEAQRKANEKAQRKADAAANFKAYEALCRAYEAQLSEFALIFKVVCWSFFIIILVYVLLMWLVVPMVDGSKRKADAAQSMADHDVEAQRIADEEAQRRADGNGQIMIRMSQSQRNADAAQSTAVEAHSDGNGQIMIRMSQSQRNADEEAQRRADAAKRNQRR